MPPIKPYEEFSDNELQQLVLENIEDVKEIASGRRYSALVDMYWSGNLFERQIFFKNNTPLGPFTEEQLETIARFVSGLFVNHKVCVLLYAAHVLHLHKKIMVYGQTKVKKIVSWVQHIS